jgi:hypothetical protein
MNQSAIEANQQPSRREVVLIPPSADEKPSDLARRWDQRDFHGERFRRLLHPAGPVRPWRPSVPTKQVAPWITVSPAASEDPHRCIAPRESADLRQGRSPQSLALCHHRLTSPRGCRAAIRLPVLIPVLNGNCSNAQPTEAEYSFQRIRRPQQSGARRATAMRSRSQERCTRM